VLLLLPLGATVVVLFRNVVGFNTYGTFLPALVAVACLETGLTWGLLGFFGIVALVAALHIPLERLGLLHTPKMAILLVLVVGALLAMAAGSTGSLFAPLTQISFFPVVILAAAAERVATNLEEEEGFETVLMSGATTGIVIMVCYAVMSSDVLARTLLIFPELLLLVVAANLWLGRWIGLRLTEYRRFRWLSPQRPVPSVLLDATRASASSPSGDARASGSSRAAMSS
jgi:hypothetical protein